MDIAGLTRKLNTTLTPDDRAGVRRTKPLNSSLESSDSSGLHRTKPLNTSLYSAKPLHRTAVKPADLEAALTKQSTLPQHEKLVKQTQNWVAQTFFGTLLKQMRESPFKSDMMDGGRGGKAFGSMYDQQLAERMSRGAGSNLVNSIVHRIEARANAVRQQLAEQRKAA